MPPPPTRRVVLLGASNLTRSISTVVETARLLFSEPLDFMVAMGHGRSFGTESSVLGRKIPGIFSARLWDDLASRPPLPTVALVTDIGNDIVYERSVKQLLGWVEGCLDRLVEVDATTIVTELPMDSLRMLGSWRYSVFRKLFFPRSRVSLEKAFSLAEKVNESVICAAQKRDMVVSPGNYAWYGFDPIHIRRRYWAVVWPEILSSWRSSDAPRVVPRGSLRRWLYLLSRVPDQRMIWWLQQHREQPSGCLSDGTRISMY